MALQAKAIKQKMKGVGNIKKITRTMEMVSVSKMKKATALALSVREYGLALNNVLAHISKKSSTDSLYTVPQGDKKILVIVGSNKGLAGNYNTLLYKKSVEWVKGVEPSSHVECITIGKQAEKIARRLKLNIKASFITFKDIPSFEQGDILFSYLNDIWKTKEYETVDIVYTQFLKPGTFATTIKQFLPISYNEHTKEIGSEINKETLFEPSEKYILDEVLPRLLEVDMYTIFADSLASEHSSRMFAMKTASDNAGELLRMLTISYNRARQDAVTQELAEIAAGSL